MTKPHTIYTINHLGSAVYHAITPYKTVMLAHPDKNDRFHLCVDAEQSEMRTTAEQKEMADLFTVHNDSAKKYIVPDGIVGYGRVLTCLKSDMPEEGDIPVVFAGLHDGKASWKNALIYVHDGYDELMALRKMSVFNKFITNALCAKDYYFFQSDFRKTASVVTGQLAATNAPKNLSWSVLLDQTLGG